MKHFHNKYIYAAFFCLFLLTACVQQEHAVSDDQKSPAEPPALTTLHEGSLHIPTKPDVPMHIFVDAPDNEGLAADLESQFQNSRFKVVDAPSKAGYILHVTLLKQGETDAAAVKAAVNSGYGTPSQMSGSGAYAMLADALMVQRRVPEAKRPSRQQLQNISARNALDSAQMRLAVLSEKAPASNDKTKFNQALARELAARIRD